MEAALVPDDVNDDDSDDEVRGDDKVVAKVDGDRRPSTSSRLLVLQ